MLTTLLRPIRAYTHWLHTRWPAGHVEKLPDVREDGSTNVPGLYVVGDLTGVPLLKLSLDSGTKAVRTIAGDPRFTPLLLGLGVRDLSMSATSLLRVKQQVRNLDMQAAARRAQGIMDQTDSGRIAALLDDFSESS